MTTKTRKKLLCEIQGVSLMTRFSVSAMKQHLSMDFYREFVIKLGCWQKVSCWLVAWHFISNSFTCMFSYLRHACAPTHARTETHNCLGFHVSFIIDWPARLASYGKYLLLKLYLWKYNVNKTYLKYKKTIKCKQTLEREGFYRLITCHLKTALVAVMCLEGLNLQIIR